MKNSQLSKITHISDLVICSMWLLLIAHEDINNWIINPFILLFPTLRIWISILMYRQSKLMIPPIIMLALMTPIAILRLEYNLFVNPLLTLLNSALTLFGFDTTNIYDNQFGDYNYTILIDLIFSTWLVIYPLVVYIHKRVKKLLIPSSLSFWKGIGLCTYILGCVIIFSIILSVSYKMTLGIAILAFMLMFIPTIFYRNNIKEMLTRGEVAYLLTVAMFTIGYVCGIGLELKSVITVCILPASFYALVNWYIHRETTYKDMQLIVGASVVFWCAQYTTNIVRVSLLILSLALMAIAAIRFIIETKKHWLGVGLYIMIALTIPIFCLGYNPYSVLDAKRYWHFDKYYGSQNGLLCVGNNNTYGLRDRYGIILPINKYDRIELLTPSKPYCKVRKNQMWQIYDIERQELVSDEWFEDIIPCDEYIYRLKSQNGDKYLIMHWYYNRYDDEQSAKVLDKLPIKDVEK